MISKGGNAHCTHLKISNGGNARYTQLKIKQPNGKETKQSNLLKKELAFCRSLEMHLAVNGAVLWL